MMILLLALLAGLCWAVKLVLESLVAFFTCIIELCRSMPLVISLFVLLIILETTTIVTEVFPSATAGTVGELYMQVLSKAAEPAVSIVFYFLIFRFIWVPIMGLMLKFYAAVSHKITGLTEKTFLFSSRRRHTR